MSSSPSHAPASPATPGPAGREAAEALPFHYPQAVVRPGQRNFALTTRGPQGTESDSSLASLAEREAQVRELGRQQGELECRARFEQQLAAERSGLAKALADFAGERAAYYQKLEEEAVRLALSIARKVLHREAQVDPLLLMGMARVALGKIEGAKSVALVVHPQHAAEWRGYLGSHLDAKDLPEIVEDPAMAPEQCALRTSMGTSGLGVELQLKEIEQGLMDLLDARPESKR